MSGDFGAATVPDALVAAIVTFETPRGRGFSESSPRLPRRNSLTQPGWAFCNVCSPEEKFKETPYRKKARQFQWITVDLVILSLSPAATFFALFVSLERHAVS